MAANEKADVEIHMTSKTLKMNNSLSVDEGIQALAADFVKVMIDQDSQLCTFLFFKRHPKPVQTEQGIMMDGVHEQAFLEVKVPLTTAFGMSIYMNEMMKEIRQSPDRKKISFGPASITNG